MLKNETNTFEYKLKITQINYFYITKLVKSIFIKVIEITSSFKLH